MTGSPHDPKPTVSPTNATHLAVAFVLTGLVAYVVVTRVYGDLPRLSLLPLVTIAALALVEAVTARATKNRIRRRPGTEPIDPLMTARLAILAKASSMGGAIFAGAYAGLLVYLFGVFNRLNSAAGDLPIALAGVAVCAALVAAALWLESSCRIPDDPDGQRT